METSDDKQKSGEQVDKNPEPSQKSGANDDLQPDKFAQPPAERAEQQVAFLKRDTEKLKQLVARAQKLYKKAEEAVEKIKKSGWEKTNFETHTILNSFINFSKLNDYRFWITACKGANSSQIYGKGYQYSRISDMESRYANKGRRYAITKDHNKIVPIYSKAREDFEKVRANFLKLEVPTHDYYFKKEVLSKYREMIKEIPKENQLVLLGMKEEVIKADIDEVDRFLEEHPQTVIGRFCLTMLGRLEQWFYYSAKFVRKIVARFLTYLGRCIEVMGGKIFWAGLLLGFLIGGILVWAFPELREIITQNFWEIIFGAIISITIGLLLSSSQK